LFPWESEKRRYYPLVHQMEADFRGFSQLPKGDSAYLTPIIPLSRIPNALKFDNTIAAISKKVEIICSSYIVDICDNMRIDHSTEPHVPVMDTFRQLLSPDTGFLKWREFVSSRDGMIPVLQGTESADLLFQADYFSDLGRGMVLRIKPNALNNSVSSATDVISALARSDRLGHLLVVLDFGFIKDATAPATQALQLTRKYMRSAGNRQINIATSATSFPQELEGEANEIVRYPIIERTLNNMLREQLGDGAANLVYSDYSSARMRSYERGGPGYPRIDYPIQTSWLSNRQKNSSFEQNDKKYTNAATRIMDSKYWDDELVIYGSSMIREARIGNMERKNSAKFWVGTRINLHLHRQAHYHSGRDEFLGYESDWED